MTLIVAIATSNYLLLASDRRVTSTDTIDGRITAQEDRDTKTITLDRRYLMGFAGLARVPVDEMDPVSNEGRRRRMEGWLATELEPQGGDYFSPLCDLIGDECERQNWTREHTFLAVGFARTPFGTTVPELVEVKNRPAAWFSFYPYRQRLGDRGYLFGYAGIAPPQASLQRLEDLLGRAAVRYGGEPHAFIEPVRRLFKETAAQSEGLVGPDCLISTLPKRAVPQDGMAVQLGDPDADAYRTLPISLFYRANGGPAISYQPAFICSEFSTWGAVVANVELGPLEGA